MSNRSLKVLLHGMHLWIDANAGTPGFAEKNYETLERHTSLKRMAEIIREQQQIIAQRQSTKHRYAGDRYYSDLQKYLLNYPD